LFTFHNDSFDEQKIYKYKSFFLWLSVREKNDINIGQNLKLPDVGSLIFYSSDPKTFNGQKPKTSGFLKNT